MKHGCTYPTPRSMKSVTFLTRGPYKKLPMISCLLALAGLGYSRKVSKRGHSGDLRGIILNNSGTLKDERSEEESPP